jgi:uncharacterized protein
VADPPVERGDRVAEVEADRAAPGLARRLAVFPIRVYQCTLSRILPPMCRFTPSCSQYAAEAILRHGVVRGILLGTWRILRCNPYCKGGDDPVPERRARRTKESMNGE